MCLNFKYQITFTWDVIFDHYVDKANGFLLSATLKQQPILKKENPKTILLAYI